MTKLFGDPKPQEKDYKSFTDYAEAALAWHDLEAERLNERIDFMEGGYEARQRKVTEMINRGEFPTAWQLKNCTYAYLADLIIDLLNKVRALRELREKSKPAGLVDCEHCHGSGQVPSGFHAQKKLCPQCNGSGIRGGK